MRYDFQSSAAKAAGYVLETGLKAHGKEPIDSIGHKKRLLRGIQPETHPLIINPKFDVVYKLKLDESYSADKKLVSVGALTFLMDEGSTMMCIGMHPELKANSSVSLDIKFITEIKVDQEFYLVCRMLDHPDKFAHIKFEYYDLDHKLLGYGSHLKIYLSFGYKAPAREKL